MADRDGRNLLDGTLSVLIAEGLFPLTAMISAAYLTRRLDRADYGTLVLCVSIVVWMQWSITTLFSRATIKFVRQADDWRPIGQTVLRQELLFGVIASLGLVALAVPAARLLQAPALVGALALLAIDIPIFCAANAHQVILVGLGGFRGRAIASAARWIVRLGLIIVLVEFGFGMHGALMGLIGASMAELAVYRCFVRPSLSGREGFPVREMLGYVAPLFVFSMSMRLFDRTDLLMVSLPVLGGSMDRAGIFGAAQQVALLPALFTGAFAPLLLSTLSHQLSNGRPEAARLIARQGLRVGVLLLPIAAVVAARADATVRTVFGTQFEAAGPLLAILFLGSCARVVVGIGASILTAIGRPTLCTWLGLPMWLTMLIAQFVVIPRFGIIGAAVTTSAVACFGAIATFVLVDHAWALRPPVSAAVRSAAVSVLVFVLASALPEARSWVLPNYLIGIAVIGLAFLGLGEFNPAERSLLRSAVGRLVQPSSLASEVV
jgi:O-antigen/teichoic acid export membrane protein